MLPHTQLCLSYLKGLEMVQQLRVALSILAKAAASFLAPTLDTLQLPGTSAPRCPILSSELCWYPHILYKITLKTNRDNLNFSFPVYVCVSLKNTHE